MDGLIQDVRYAWRRLAADRLFAAVAVLTLGLGIGATTTMFSVTYAVLLRALPFPAPDRLVAIAHLFEGRQAVMAPPNFLDATSGSLVLEAAGAWNTTGATLTGDGNAVRVQGADVTAGFFDVLNTPALVGRTLDERDVRDRSRTIVLGYGLWRERFGGDASIVGRAIVVDAEPWEVVGVMPAGFAFPEEATFWRALPSTIFAPDNRGAWYLNAFGRLRPDRTVVELVSELKVVAGRLERDYPRSNTGLGLTAVSLQERLVGSRRPALLVLLGAVGLVLAIACANVANLLLARAATRRTEFAVRASLGAGPARLLRQLLSESLLIAGGGVAVGLLLALWGQSAVAALSPGTLPRAGEIAIDLPVVLFAVGLAALATLVFGAAPALFAARQSPSRITVAARSIGASGGHGLRATFVVTQTAFAIALVVGALLLIRSFVNLRHVDPGFRTDGALTFRLALPTVTYRAPSDIRQFYDRLLERLRGLPGVTSAATSAWIPLATAPFNFSYYVDGRPPVPPGVDNSLEARVVGDTYFQTLGLGLVSGRFFTAADTEGAPAVAIISRSAADTIFAGQDPIGQTMRIGWRGEGGERRGGRIVGVVEDTRELGLSVAPQPTIYLPHGQAPVRAMGVVMRTSVPPRSLSSAVEREVRGLDRNVPVVSMRPLDVVLQQSIAQPRLHAALLGGFAMLAVAIAATGVFGMMSYLVSLRSREIGVRLALGAKRSGIFAMILRDALLLTGAGVVGGLAMALAFGRVLGKLLFGVAPRDPLTMAIAAATLACAAVLASAWPALRAASVDPIVVLRAD